MSQRSPIKETFPSGTGKPYGSLKVANEVLLEAYQRLYGFEFIMLRPANVFGLGHFWSGSGGGEKMQTLLQNGLQGKKATIFQDQTMANEYIYAKDIGKAIDLATTIPLPSETIFNIGNGEVTPFSELVETVKKFIPELQIEIKAGDSPVSKSQPLDISQAMEHLSWEPQFSLEEAFQDYIKDLKAAEADIQRSF
ncbi:NAD-dependent epimerase/dehydratase family protein [Thermodesulfobacteriota bacterium]